MLVWHLVLLGTATSALAAAALRVASRLGTTLLTRVLGAAAVGAAVAMVEALLLGLAGTGGSPLVLTAAAGGTWGLARALVDPPRVTVRSQLGAEWAAASTSARAATGAFAAFLVGVVAFQSWHPALGLDGLDYHAAQAVVWVVSGHPGAQHQTIGGIPTQAYPRTLEVLVAWTYAIGRTPVAAIPFMTGLATLAAVATVGGLRRMGVSTAWATLATAAGLLLPLDVIEMFGVFNDLAALAWLVTTVTLALASVEEPTALGLAAVSAGLAIGTKPTTGPFVVVALGAALWVSRGRLRPALRALAGPAGLSVAVGGVWYVQDLVAYGAPVWPFYRFPSGKPQPLFFQAYGARFLSHPLLTARTIGGHLFVHFYAGGLVLLAGLVPVLLLTLLPAVRSQRRVAVIGSCLVALDLLLWANAQFTGITHGSVLFAVTGLRYVTSAPLAAAAVLALVARTGGRARAVPGALLVAALGLDLVELRPEVFPYPVRPGAGTCLVLLVVGGVAGALTGSPARVRRLARAGAWTAPVATVGAAALLALPASTFLAHYLAAARQQGYGDADVLTYLRREPGWVHGHAPVAAGRVAYATLAGPQLTHQLSFIPDDESCPAVLAAARDGWVVLKSHGGGPAFHDREYVSPTRCLQGVPPAAVLGDGTRVYAPARLLADPPSQTRRTP